MTKMALEIVQVITYTLGGVHNVNVRHNNSLMLNMLVSIVVYKSFLIKFILEFIVVVGGGILYIRWEVL